MTPREQRFFLIKDFLKAIKAYTLTPEEIITMRECENRLMQLIHEYGKPGLIALSLVATEIIIKESDDHV